MKRALFAFGAALLIAGTALAHSGVKNPDVKARMDSMGRLAAELKTLGQMARGRAAFDPDQAAAAIAAMRIEADQTPSLFKVRADDPKSEARPAIWNEWSAFMAQAEALNAALRAADVTSQTGVQRAMGAIGATCKACHEDYRE